MKIASLKSLFKKKIVVLIICSSLAFFISLVLFFIMSALISKTPNLKKNSEISNLINFIRVPPRSFLDEKKRKLPLKKQKEKKPPKMKKLSSALSKPQKIQSNMDMPNIKSLLHSKGLTVGGGNPGLGSEVTPLVRIEPQYPRKAALQGIEGWVILQFNISSTGRVNDIRILNSKPRRVFDRVAVKALKKWKYRPKMEGSKPVEQKGLKVQLDFKLE